MSLLKDVGLWDILAGLSLSRFKAAGQPIPASIISYPSSIASSVPTGKLGKNAMFMPVSEVLEVPKVHLLSPLELPR